MARARVRRAATRRHATKSLADKDDASSACNKHFRLLDLPAEIRNYIYEYLPAAAGLNDRTVRLRACKQRTNDAIDRHFPWLFANRQLYNETRHLFYRHFICCFDLDGTLMPSVEADISKFDSYRRTVFNGCVGCDTVRCVVPYTGWPMSWEGRDRILTSLESILRIQARNIQRTVKLAKRAGVSPPTRRRTLEVHLLGQYPFAGSNCFILKRCLRIARSYATLAQLQIYLTYTEQPTHLEPPIDFGRALEALDVTLLRLPEE